MTKTTISFNSKKFFTLGLGYLAIPIIIFFIGFLKIWIGAILSVLLLGAIYLTIRDVDKSPEGELTTTNEIKIPVSFLVIISLLALFISYFTGVGEFVWTTYDHAFRRAMLKDLIDYSWPVIYSPSTQTNQYVVQIINMKDNAFYVYYLCYWLPAALVGKVCGFTVANIFLLIWNSLGIVITVLGMSLFAKRPSYSTMFMFMCFSGLDVIPYYLHELINYQDWWWVEGYVTNMSLISNVNSLMNIYNQCIPCWIITLLIIMAINNRSIGLIGSMLFAYSPWGTIGLLPIAIVKVFQRKMAAKTMKKRVVNILTIQNILPAILMLFVFGSYYMCKSDATSVSGFTASFFDTKIHFAISYIVLIVIEVVPVFIFLFRNYKKNPLFWASIAILLILPFYKITEQNDLLMRGAMAPLFVLCVFAGKRLSEISAEIRLKRRKNEKFDSKSILKLVPVVLLMAGMAYMTYFMGTVVLAASISDIDRPDNDIGSFGNINKPDYAEKIEDQFFAYDYENLIFYKYLAKK